MTATLTATKAKAPTLREFATNKREEANTTIGALKTAINTKVLAPLELSNFPLLDDDKRAKLREISNPRKSDNIKAKEIVTLEDEAKAQNRDLQAAAVNIMKYYDSANVPAQAFYEDVTVNDIHTPFHVALNHFADTIDQIVKLGKHYGITENDIRFSKEYPKAA